MLFIFVFFVLFIGYKGITVVKNKVAEMTQKTDISVATKSLINVFILLLKVNIYG